VSLVGSVQLAPPPALEPPAGRVDICLVANFAYGAMVGGDRGHIGGVERQVSLMSRWLAARGHRVSVVTWDEGQDDDVLIDGVRLIKLCRQDAGLPGLRFFHPRWTSLNAALARADADVYYQNCSEYVTGQVALWARRKRRKFVFSVANDLECDPGLPDLPTRREKLLYAYGLRHAHDIVVQTGTQARMLREGFGLGSSVIPMPCPGPSEADYARSEPPRPGAARLLWLARIARVKRPDRYLDLAEACPDLQFDLVGPLGDGDYPVAVVERARRLANVSVHGPAARGEVSDFLRRAACMVCTSDNEGFPNVFLEAWSHGLPIVSTFDPDGLIASRGLGLVADRTVASLEASVRRLLGSPDEWRAASAAARAYYAENHTLDRVMVMFERLFLQVAARE
jgi:glycosyltransferase involved in cell wall biosynthesis